MKKTKKKVINYERLAKKLEIEKESLREEGGNLRAKMYYLERENQDLKDRRTKSDEALAIVRRDNLGHESIIRRLENELGYFKSLLRDISLDADKMKILYDYKERTNKLGNHNDPLNIYNR